MKLLTFIIVIAVGLATRSVALASPKHDHHHQHSHAHGEAHESTDDENNHEAHENEQASTIEDAMAKEVGIITAKARAQTLHQRIVLYGKLATASEQLSHVRARYTGLIKSVSCSIGDSVKQGSILAQVESNESLKTYSINAPINGIVIQRHANKGEITQNQVLFSIANFDTLWAELRIYPMYQSLVAKGQHVKLEVNGEYTTATVEHIIPILDKPYQMARVKIDNSQLGWAPGTLTESHIIVNEFPVNLAVEKLGIQTIGEDQGVFVQSGNEFRFSPLVLGRSDQQYVEVISGLIPGQRYVTENSYLIKADIEKSEAEHNH
ncbi:MAG: efflux RND transporter periplasmic adaptor subunit [Pseudomonadales bacterium]|nr:efflux RND transporter periplasmic adaptor subunit [Pseudomonadales bacterium]